MIGGLVLEGTVTALVSQYGFVALFVFLFFETSMTFPFVPSELVVPFGAALLVTSPATFLALVLAAAAGGTLGSLFAYYVFDAAHQPIIDRYGAYIHVSETDVERAGYWFRRWGESAVLWGRLLPVVRSVISIPAGIAGMHAGKFAIYSGMGTGLFAAGVAALIATSREALPFQLLIRWTSTLFDHTVAAALAAPSLAIAAGGLSLFVVLVARNAYSVRRDAMTTPADRRK